MNNFTSVTRFPTPIQLPVQTQTSASLNNHHAGLQNTFAINHLLTDLTKQNQDSLNIQQLINLIIHLIQQLSGSHNDTTPVNVNNDNPLQNMPDQTQQAVHALFYKQLLLMGNIQNSMIIQSMSKSPFALNSH